MQQRDMEKDPTLANETNLSQAPARPRKAADGSVEITAEAKTHFFEMSEGMFAALHSKQSPWDEAIDVLPRFDVTERMALVSLFEANHGVDERTPSVTLTGLARKDRLEQALAVLHPVISLARAPDFPEGYRTLETLEEEIARLREEIQQQIAAEAAKKQAKPDAEKEKKQDEEDKKKKKKKES